MDYHESKIPEFKCHKKVKAFRIGGIEKIGRVLVNGANDIDYVLHSANQDHSVTVDGEYMEKHDPQPGGYYVLYADGYESFSPAKTFEEGYVLADDGEDKTQCP